MKETFKTIHVLVIIAISPLILALPAYFRCTQASQAKFVSSDLSFENQDQEEGMPDSEKELKGYGSSALLVVFHLGANLFKQSSNLFSQMPCPRQEMFVLRC